MYLECLVKTQTGYYKITRTHNNVSSSDQHALCPLIFKLWLTVMTDWRTDCFDWPTIWLDCFDWLITQPTHLLVPTDSKTDKHSIPITPYTTTEETETLCLEDRMSHISLHGWKVPDVSHQRPATHNVEDVPNHALLAAVPEGVAKPTVILKMEIYVCSRRRRQTDCHTENGNICMFQKASPNRPSYWKWKHMYVPEGVAKPTVILKMEIYVLWNHLVVWRHWTCSWTLVFMDLKIICSITEVNKYFVGILNSWKITQN